MLLLYYALLPIVTVSSLELHCSLYSDHRVGVVFVNPFLDVFSMMLFKMGILFSFFTKGSTLVFDIFIQNVTAQN